MKKKAHAEGIGKRRGKNPAFPEIGMGLAINLAEGKRNWNGGPSGRHFQPQKN